MSLREEHQRGAGKMAQWLIHLLLAERIRARSFWPLYTHVVHIYTHTQAHIYTEINI